MSYPQPSPAAAGLTPVKAVPRQRAGQPLPTDRLKREIQLKLLASFARLSGRAGLPVSTVQVAESVKISAATAGLSNMFFVASGWLERKGKQYSASSALVDYYNRVGTNHPQAVMSLALSARASWYSLALLPRLNGGPLKKDEVIYLLIDAAAATPEHRDQVEALLDWMAFLGLIVITDDDIALGGGLDTVALEEPAVAAVAPDRPSRAEVSEPTTSPARESERDAVVLAFDFGVKLSASDIAALSPDQIKALFEAVGTVVSLTGNK